MRPVPLAIVFAGFIAAVLVLAALPSSHSLPTSWGSDAATRAEAVAIVRRTLSGDADPAHGATLLRSAHPRRVHVTLHQGGKSLRQEALEASIADSLVAAARKHLPALRGTPLGRGPMWVKIDVETGSAALPDAVREEDLEPVFETGLDGIRAEITGDPARVHAGVVLPADPITEGWFSPRPPRPAAPAKGSKNETAIARRKRERYAQARWFTRGDEGFASVQNARTRLAQAAGGVRAEDRVKITRFRTESFLAPLEPGRGDGNDVTLLYRGVPAADVDVNPDAATLRASAIEGGDWLVAQLSTAGKFNYTVLPNRGPGVQSDGGYSTIRHIACAWMLVKIGRRFDEKEWVDAGYRAVRWLEPYVVAPDDKTGGDRLIVKAPNESLGGLGHNAMAVIAMAEMRDVLTPAEIQRLKLLGRSLERALRDDGGFFENETEVVKRPPGKQDTLLYEPGEAFLALVMLAEAFPEEKHWLESALKSAEYQAGKFEDAGDGLFKFQIAERMRFVDRIHWQAQALEKLGALTKDARWDETNVAIGHAIVASGMPPVTVRLAADGRPIGPIPPDYNGSFTNPGRIPRTTPTGSRAEALNACRRSALAAGMKRDAKQFEATLRRVAGFQLRNQFDDTFCYFCPDPSIARGAYRAGMSDNEVRIDYIQHIVAGMSDTLLWLEQEPAAETSASRTGR